jgi:enhancing lycopene biosynthesis protein 2
MSQKKTIGVVLAGCGVYDGAEIHEAVLTLLAVDRLGHNVLICAPNVDQAHVVNHLTGEATAERRNVLVESARIARGRIRDLATVRAKELDAVIFPGGFGAAKNLCTFATDGIEMRVHPEVERIIGEMRTAGKPIGLMCISPALGARLLPGLRLTFGAACDASAAAERLGAHHVVTRVDEVVLDEDQRVVTTGAYMLGPWIADVARGVDALVARVAALA